MLYINIIIQEVGKTKKQILQARKTKMLLSFILVIAIIFNVMSISVFAVYDDDMSGTNYYSGGFTSVNGIKYTYTTGTATANRTYVQQAAARWSNNVSSNVYLQKNTTMTNNGYLAPIVVSVLEYTPVNSTLLGRMYPYKSFTPTSATSATNSETWVKAFCYTYNNSLFNVPGMTTQQKRVRIAHTVTHEMGHALSVGHINPNTTYTYDDMEFAVMNTGCSPHYTLREFDIAMLRAKWGN